MLFIPLIDITNCAFGMHLLVYFFLNYAFLGQLILVCNCPIGPIARFCSCQLASKSRCETLPK